MIDVTAAPSDDSPFYDRIGGQEFFVGLVNKFYDGVAHDEVLRPMYEDEDLTEAKHKLVYFLMQYWGGPKTYSEWRGHPKLRMRHNPFVIDAEARDRWLLHMKAAILEMDPEPALRDELWTYLVSAAYAMQNTESGSPSPGQLPPPAAE
jgi:hemoglobin